MNLDEKKKFIINFAYFSVWVVILYLLFKVAAIYFFPFLIGIIIAYTVQKPADFLSKKTKIKKQNCAAVLSVVVFVTVIILVTLLCWLLYSQINRLIYYLSNHSGSIKRYIENLYKYFENLFKNIDGEFQTTIKRFSYDTFNSFIAKISVYLSNGVTAFIKKLPTLLISCVVTVVATYYISKDYFRLLKFARGFLSNKFYRLVADIKNIFTECFFKFVVGYFWLFIITFCELSVGFLLLNIKNFILLAALVAILDLLPVIGTGTILLPWAIFMFLQNEYRLGIGLVVLYFLITVARNFVEPKIIGKQIGINPLFTLIFIFLGLRAGGIIGMIIFPIAFTVFFTYYKRQVLNSD